MIQGNCDSRIELLFFGVSKQSSIRWKAASSIYVVRETDTYLFGKRVVLSIWTTAARISSLLDRLGQLGLEEKGLISSKMFLIREEGRRSVSRL